MQTPDAHNSKPTQNPAQVSRSKLLLNKLKQKVDTSLEKSNETTKKPQSPETQIHEITALSQSTDQLQEKHPSPEAIKSVAEKLEKFLQANHREKFTPTEQATLLELSELLKNKSLPHRPPRPQANINPSPHLLTNQAGIEKFSQRSLIHSIMGKILSFSHNYLGIDLYFDTEGKLLLSKSFLPEPLQNTANQKIEDLKRLRGLQAEYLYTTPVGTWIQQYRHTSPAEKETYTKELTNYKNLLKSHNINAEIGIDFQHRLLHFVQNKKDPQPLNQLLNQQFQNLEKPKLFSQKINFLTQEDQNFGLELWHFELLDNLDTQSIFHETNIPLGTFKSMFITSHLTANDFMSCLRGDKKFQTTYQKLEKEFSQKIELPSTSTYSSSLIEAMGKIIRSGTQTESKAHQIIKETLVGKKDTFGIKSAILDKILQQLSLSTIQKYNYTQQINQILNEKIDTGLTQHLIGPTSRLRFKENTVILADISLNFLTLGIQSPTQDTSSRRIVVLKPDGTKIHTPFYIDQFLTLAQNPNPTHSEQLLFLDFLRYSQTQDLLTPNQ